MVYILFSNSSIGKKTVSWIFKIHTKHPHLDLPIISYLEGGGGAKGFGPVIFPFCSPQSLTRTYVKKYPQNQEKLQTKCHFVHFYLLNKNILLTNIIQDIEMKQEYLARYSFGGASCWAIPQTRVLPILTCWYQISLADPMRCLTDPILNTKLLKPNMSL